MISLLSMFLLGLAGSLHCAVMCGPLCMALPLSREDKNKMLIQSFIYHSGRILGYASLGMVIGLAGQALVFMRIQNVIIISTGILFLIIGAYQVSKKNLNFSYFTQLQQPKLIKKTFSTLINRSDKASIVAMGFLNGLLPCGLVYSALALSIQNFTIKSTIINMVFFGFGTLPMMISLTAGIGATFFSKKINFKSVSPYIFLLMGILMIYRGLNMNLPTEVSLWESLNYPIMCH